MVCNEQHARDWTPTLAAVGFEVADPAASAARARALDAPAVYRRTLANEQELAAFRAPDGTEVFLGRRAASARRRLGPGVRGRPGAGGAALLTGIDHVNLAAPWQCFDEAVLFYSSVLGLAVRDQPGGPGAERAGAQPGRPLGVGRVPAGAQRRPAGVGPVRLPAARRLLDRRRHRPSPAAPSSADCVPLPIPQNYYDDLMARFDLAGPEVETMAELGLLYDRDAAGDFTHFYTATVGGVFFEVVQRRGAYDGYGAHGRRRPARRPASPRSRVTVKNERDPQAR